ncbi:histidine phosphatase family protein [Aliarcobacter butzleri]|uniref:histidine phosphatase family protein n=2 Tax=Aliarcobacter butzleri TaxID=28197 RepID=UPI001650FC51|nr:histidine phosphatase family protein [Aliarcobacter butzleri]
MRKFYFMRHGQTDLNRLNKYTGILDYPLNSIGIAQCINVKKTIHRLDIKKVHSSSLLRAKQTAKLVTDKKVIILKELDERDFGVFTGIKKVNYKKNFFPKGESSYQLKNRVSKVFKKIELESNSLIVSHSRVFKTICEILQIKTNGIKNCEIVKFKEIIKDHWKVIPINQEEFIYE